MQRRDFLSAAGLLAGLPLIPNLSFAQGSQLEEPIKPVLLPPQAPLDHKGGMDIRVWVRSSMTGGVYSSVECAVAPKVMGPPPHLHKELDELMLVLEGTASVLIDGEVVEIAAGGWHLRPRNLVHTFFNASDKPLRFIDMYFNQPFEEFLEKVFFEYTPEKGYPFGSKEREVVMNKLNEHYGLVYAPTANDERNELIKKYGLK
ncbi:MAG: cupin domain-containing protein [Chitinophagales bacterium]|nr:cupin domain-containing protein [Chitinophagales bacterium]